MLKNETRYRKLIVWMAEEEGETKDQIGTRLQTILQASDFDVEATIFETDERQVALSFSGGGPNPLQILDAVDATLKGSQT